MSGANSSKYGDFINEHNLIENLVEEVLATVRAGDWAQCNEAWSQLAVTVENHLAVEELMVFPNFPGRGLIHALEGEHIAIRARLEELAHAIHEERAGQDELLGLLAEIREHGAHEDAVLYPALSRAG